MKVYVVTYDNGQWNEDYEEVTEGIFSSREKAQEWINAHPINAGYKSLYNPSRDITEYELDKATEFNEN